MSHHLDEIDRAVALARRAATSGHLGGPERLTRFLYRSWYLGVPATVPAPRSPHAPTPWRAWSPSWTDRRTCHGADLMRVYLSVAPHTGLHAVAAATRHLEGWDVPWLLSSRALGRAVPHPDSTVLYVPVAAMDRLAGPLRSLARDVQPFLASSVPALTLKVARGVSLAQNPADGRSYGVHRCSIIAGSVLSSPEAQHRELVERTLCAFSRAHVDPHRPYRALGASWEWDRRALVA